MCWGEGRGGGKEKQIKTSKAFHTHGAGNMSLALGYSEVHPIPASIEPTSLPLPGSILSHRYCNLARGLVNDLHEDLLPLPLGKDCPQGSWPFNRATHVETYLFPTRRQARGCRPVTFDFPNVHPGLRLIVPVHVYILAVPWYLVLISYFALFSLSLRCYEVSRS